jgi:hypothetical protein
VLDATMFIVKLPDEKSFGTELGALTLPQAEARNTRGTQSLLITFVPGERAGRLSHFTRVDCFHNVIASTDDERSGRAIPRP